MNAPDTTDLMGAPAGDSASLRPIRIAVTDAAGLYHRLVLVIAPPGSGKTSALRALAASDGHPLINVNLRLGERLLDLTRRQRALDLPRLLAEVLDATASDVVLLDNIELLFATDLSQDPLRVLSALSRNRTIVAAWPGVLIDGALTYAEPAHQEYRRYLRPEALFVELAGLNRAPHTRDQNQPG